MAEEEKTTTQTTLETGVITIDEGAADSDTILAMAKQGVMYGHKKSRRNPNFQEYVYTVRNGVEVVDLVKTLAAIDVVAQYLAKNRADKKTFIVVATQPAARDAVKRLAAALGDCPSVMNKWIGGLLSNFPVISRRIEYFKKRKQDFVSQKFGHYTKKEQLGVEREIIRMEQKFSGLESLAAVPDIMIIVDSSLKSHRTAIREARMKNVTLVGIIDNDDDPTAFDYFIPANDHGKASIEWVVDHIIEKMS